MNYLLKLKAHIAPSATQGVFLLIVKFLSTLSTIAFSFLLARILVVETFGQIAQNLSVVLVISALGTLGLNRVLLRRSPRHLKLGSTQSVFDEVHYVVKVVFKASAGISVIICLLVFFYLKIFEAESWRFYLFASFAFSAIPMSLNLIYAGALKSIGKPVKATFLENSLGFLLAGVMSYLTFLSSVSSDVLGLYVGLFFLFSMIVNLVLSYVSWVSSASKIGIRKRLLDTAVDSYELLRLGRSFLITGVMLAILSATDLLFLGFLESDSVSGIYSVGLKISSLITFVVFTLQPIFSTKFSSDFVDLKLGTMQKTANIVAILGFISGALLIVPMYYFGESILGLYGVEFVDGFASLMILAAFQLLVVSLGPAPALMNMTNSEVAARNISIVTVLINLFLNPLAIVIYGMEGAAMATGLSLTINKVVSVWYVYDKCGICTIPFINRDFIRNP